MESSREWSPREREQTVCRGWRRAAATNRLAKRVAPENELAFSSEVFDSPVDLPVASVVVEEDNAFRSEVRQPIATVLHDGVIAMPSVDVEEVDRLAPADGGVGRALDDRVYGVADTASKYMCAEQIERRHGARTESLHLLAISGVWVNRDYARGLNPHGL